MKRTPWMTLALSLGTALALPARIPLTGHSLEPQHDDPAQLPWWMDDQLWGKDSCALHDALWHKTLRSLADEASSELACTNLADDHLQDFTFHLNPAGEHLPVFTFARLPGPARTVAAWWVAWVCGKTNTSAGSLMKGRLMAERALQDADPAGHRSARQGMTTDDDDSGYRPLRPGQNDRQHRKG